MRRLAIAFAIVVLSIPPYAARAGDAPPAPAKDPQAARMVKAFRDWAAAWGVPVASFAVMRGENPVGQAGLGGRGPSDSASVASLSKAITGVCVVKLVEAGKLRYADRLGTLIPSYFKDNKPADAAARRITVAQLLTQTSGLAYDPTQGTAEFAALDFSRPNMPAQLQLALARPLGPKVHVYNNINYLALGLVIEAVSSETYERHCRKSVLAPVGAGATRITPNWRILSSYGGWSISAIDYARFADHFRPGSKLLKSKAAAWPKSDLGDGAYYSVGVYMRRSGSSWNIWHAGGWSWSSPTVQSSFGAYVGVIRQNLRFVANFEPRPASQAYADLDHRVYTAAEPSLARTLVDAAPDGSTGDAPGGSDRGEADAAIAASQATAR